MANATVTTTNSTLVSETGGFRTVLVQNVGTGGLWVLTSPDANATVTSSNGIYVGIGSTVPVPLYQGHLRAISNGTSDVRYT